jgi:hypothetical protein
VQQSEKRGNHCRRQQRQSSELVRGEEERELERQVGGRLENKKSARKKLDE